MGHWHQEKPWNSAQVRCRLDGMQISRLHGWVSEKSKRYYNIPQLNYTCVNRFFFAFTGLVDFNEIESYMARIRLQNGGVKVLFPLLSVSDVVLDAQFERHCISCDIECEEEIQPFPSGTAMWFICTARWLGMCVVWCFGYTRNLI